MHKCYYCREDYGNTIEDRFEFESIWELKEGNFRYIFAEIAEDYHSEHDGWESTWPLTFILFDENGKELCRCSVGREAQPIFYPGKVIKVEG